MKNLLTPEERLTLLQTLDRNRPWYSLDDKRTCLVCQRVFSGREIQILERADNGFSLHCPTPDCPSDSAQWSVWQEIATHKATEIAGLNRDEFSFL